MAEYKVNYTQSNFTGGIIAAELYGRNDFNKVKSGLKQCVNWTIREAGGLEFRRGTKYLATIPTSAGAIFKTASLGEEFFVFGVDGIHWLKDGTTFELLEYPEKPEDISKIQFTELQRRLYFYDGEIKLSQITLDDEGTPQVAITKFEGELPEGATIVAERTGTDPDPLVEIEYQYAMSVAKDEEHESIAKPSDVVMANAELTDSAQGHQINITMSLPESIVSAGGKVLLYKKYQGKFYYLDSIFLEDFAIPEGGAEYQYVYSDKGQFSPDVSRAIKEKPEYLESDGSVIGVNSIADYGQRIFMTIQGLGTNIIFSQVGNTDSLAYSELRNEDEAGYLEVPISHFDDWCKVVAGLDLIFSTSYTISQIQGYGDLQLQTVLFDGFSKTVQPVTTRRSLIYTNSNNRNIYDLTYNEYGQYDGIDLTLLVKYIFETKTIKRLAFKDYPVKTIYVLCDDGDLYCLTYIKDQNIYAWYKIEHYDKIHDLLVVNRETEDEIYLSVETEKTQYDMTYGWHEGVGENEEKYTTVLGAYSSSKKTYYIYSLLDENDNTYQYGFLNELPAVGDKAFLFRSVEQVISGEEPVIVTDTGFTVSSVNYNSILEWYEIELSNGKGIIKSSSAPRRDCVEVQTDNKGIVVVKSSLDKSLCLPDQADKVISLYESEGVNDYVVLDQDNNRFWGEGYTDVQFPVYVVERAYNRTDSIYMDSSVLVERQDIVDNKITGLPAHMVGKKVRVFDLGNNLYYGNYDIRNPKSITQGGNVVQIDDLDFDGYEVAADGSIQLEDYIEITGNVYVGLPYYAVAETIPLEFSDQNGNSTIGRKKNITEAYLRYGDSRGLTYKTLGKEYDCGIAKKDVADNAEFLERGQVRLDVASEYKWDSTIKILQRQPYPARIESITLGLHFNDKS